MDQELAGLVETLHEVAFEAGCALLRPATDPAPRQRCRQQLSEVCRRLRALAPEAARRCALPPDASPGAIRLAARDVAATVRRMHTLSQCQRSAA